MTRIQSLHSAELVLLEVEGQLGLVTRAVCTLCNPRVTAHCSSELQFLRSLSLVIVCAVRGSHRRADFYRKSLSRDRTSTRNEIQGELRFESTRTYTHELDTVTRLVPKDRDLRAIIIWAHIGISFLFFLFDAHWKKYHRNQNYSISRRQCSRDLIDK